jgi:hypothetical protein
MLRRLLETFPAAIRTGGGEIELFLNSVGGGRGIRTHEAFLLTGFQDQLHRPLGQTSATEFIANQELARTLW